MDEKEARIPRLCVVVPCYDEEEVLPETTRRLGDKLVSLVSAGLVDPASAVLFVDDGSSDRTWELISAAHEADPRFMGIGFAHNAGHQNALYAGLMEALDCGFDCAVSLDADLQDDVDAMDQMVQKHVAGAEIVYGVRNNRDTDSGFKRSSAETFYGLMRRLGVEMVSDSADYRLMGRRSLEALSQYQEVNLFLRGIVPSLGFSTDKVFYRRGERFAGESKYPLKKMVSFAIDGITSFSITPIRMVAGLGVVSIVVSILMLVYALVSAATGNAVSGWTSLIVSIWLVGGLIMVSLGVVGEYVGHIYLETKHRPRYIIETRLP
jgi:glycosyltransferase involved in cell wall biosynthesis